MQEDDSRERLIRRYFDDALAPAHEAELLASLENSPEVRRQFADEAFLDCNLREVMREADIQSFIASDENEPSLATPIGNFGVSTSRARYSNVFLGAIAATILIAAAFSVSGFVFPRRAPDAAAIAQEPATKAVGAEAVVSVGTIVQQRDCKWAPKSSAWRNGDSLPPNTVLSLQSGAAEVALENGVRLLLAGPCQIQLVSEMRGKVFRGSLTAKVPPNAHGFTLVTPSSQVIDLGTEFGILVDRGGESEVHVFEGEVISRWYGANGKVQGGSLRLREKHAARYGLNKSEAALMTADETRFVRDLAPRLPLESLPPLPVRQNLALWLSADQFIETDETGGVKSWNDLLCEPSQAFQVALQLDPKSRPRLIPDAVGGMPAVRFDGVDDYLVTTPLETTDNQTIVAVLGLSNSRPAFGQIVNYNGPPHRQLRFPATPGVLQINARRLDNGEFQCMGLINSGWSPDGWTIDGRVRASLPRDSNALTEPVIICYRYDATSNQAMLYVNGKLFGQTSAPWPAGLTSRKVIGRRGYDATRPLNADIAELIIYNQSLPDDQLADVTKYLTDRYGNLSKEARKAAE